MGAAVGAYRHYAIPFANRESSEAVWLHLLKVKSPGAPIVLKRAPSLGFDESKAGVCIHTPPAGEAAIEDATKGPREKTIYIDLIVDGNIVDLNRIPLPPDTPIVDERFKDGATQKQCTTEVLPPNARALLRPVRGFATQLARATHFRWAAESPLRAESPLQRMRSPRRRSQPSSAFFEPRRLLTANGQAARRGTPQ